MIEINLIPDIKREFLRAQRSRRIVVTLAILSSAAAGSLVVLLALWVYGAQAVRGTVADKAIERESQKLLKVSDISKTLTIQNQLRVLPGLHEDKYLTSRIFDVLTTIAPPPPNEISISKTVLDTANKTVLIEAQAPGGYAALEVFKKTISATQFSYDVQGKAVSVPLASSMNDGDRSYGEDSTGRRVLRFILSFTYPEEMLQPYLTKTLVVGPTTTNATDSYRSLPQSLFQPKANDTRKTDQ